MTPWRWRVVIVIADVGLWIGIYALITSVL